MAVLRAVMRIFSFLYHGLLALFLLAISVVALTSGQSLHLGMLPGQGRNFPLTLFCSALAGLIVVILAVRRRWRALFFLWSLAALAILVRGFFFSSYHFDGPPGFHRAIYLIAGALLAACGAWFQLRVAAR